MADEILSSSDLPAGEAADTPNAAAPPPGQGVDDPKPGVDDPKPAGEAPEQRVDGTAERIVEPTVEQSAQATVEQAVEQDVEQDVEQRVEQAVEQPVEQQPPARSDNDSEASIKQPVDASIGAPIGPPVDAARKASSERPAAQQPTAPPQPQQPSVAATLTVEPLPQQEGTAGQGDHEEGGEWHLLLAKLRQWLDHNELQSLWAQARRPVTSLAALIGLLLVLRVYSAVLGALDSLPLIPGLLELAGVAWLLRYGVPKLLRSSERERLTSGLRNRWNAFRGKG